MSQIRPATFRPIATLPAYHVAFIATVTALVLLLGACGPSPVSDSLSGGEPADSATEPGKELPRQTRDTESEDTVDTNAESVAKPIQVDQLQIELIPVVSQLQEPIFVTHAGDGSIRLFIVEKAGRILVMQDGELLADPFLDIRDRVERDGLEMGLLGLAFPPNYAETGHFFVNYTGKGRQTHVDRFSITDSTLNIADPDSRFTVLTFAQPAGNHNGGMLAFGPDGYLYIGTGDGGAAFDRFDNGQNPATMLGKMLRVDVTSDPSVSYQIPADNPWVESDLDGADVLDEIWAIGLRNPWRYSFDRASGDLWIADVGQNKFEEVNLTPAGSTGGLNFGWPIQEATHCLKRGCDSTGLIQPILEYSHAGGNCSITGGYVYRGSGFPELDGVYLYGDYCTGAIWAAAPDDNGVWQSGLIHRADAQISSFGEDEGGELYLTDLNGGVVYRVAVAE